MLKKEMKKKSTLARMLDYAKPYYKYFILVFILMIISTGLELLRPYILKVTIDDYINGYQKNMIVSSEIIDENSVLFNENYYTRIKDGNNLNKPQANIVRSKDGYSLKTSDNSILLNKEDYSKFRKIDIDGINRISFIFLIAIVLNLLFSYLQTIILNRTSQKIIFNIRRDTFSHIQKLSLSYFDNNPIGKLVTRVTNDTESLNEMYTEVLVSLFKDVFILIGIIFIMLRMDLKLAFISLSLVPLILVISILFRKAIIKVYRLNRKQLSEINSDLNENISGMKTIQIFNQEDKISNNFDLLNKAYLNTSKKEVNLFAVFRPSVEFIRSMGIAALIYIGGGDAISGALEFGVLYAFIDYLQKFFNPILDLTEKYNVLQSAIASSERIFSILDTEDFIENPINPIESKRFDGHIEFKNVNFSYDGLTPVLKDLSFTIEPGESVAIVGPTGAGKTSIINLLTRLYDINSGEILIDGVNINKYKKEDLRNQIGVVLQDVFLFSGDIKGNISLNNPNIKIEEIIEASKYVNAHNFIKELENQYDEVVVERGSTLSTGERQLLSFARTLLYNPSILILDEATSNIDTETEILIQDSLKKLMKDRTSIAIAHRLSTIQNSDKIIVLSKGEIVEMGSHNELLKEKGFYYDLYKLQYKEN